MSRRAIEYAALAVVLGALVALALASARPAPSTYSTFDTGPNGYRALYEVLRRENVPVARLEEPLGELAPQTRVLAATPALPALHRQLPIAYDAADVKRIELFVKGGGMVLAFGRIPDLKPSPRVHVLDVTRFTNAGLARDPQNAAALYALVAGRGVVAFDERLHGYDVTQSLWQVLPPVVRAATWLAGVAVLLALVEANVRFAPPVPIEPPQDRDSSDYVRSMARLLRRARAGRAAIERFAQAAPDDLQLARLAADPHPSDAALLRAAVLFSERRKDRR